jgi:hypothetical protein
VDDLDRKRWASRFLSSHDEALHAGPNRSLAGLGWVTIAELAANPSTHPSLRRRAEKWLEARLPELALGERIALARRATRPLIAALAASTEPAVLVSLLGNERCTEADAIRIAAARNTPSSALERMLRHPTWGARRSVRLALSANPGTPVPTALRALQGLEGPDLRRLAGDERTPRIVRVGAARMLSSEDPGASRSGRSTETA